MKSLRAPLGCVECCLDCRGSDDNFVACHADVTQHPSALDPTDTYKFYRTYNAKMLLAVVGQ